MSEKRANTKFSRSVIFYIYLEKLRNMDVKNNRLYLYQNLRTLIAENLCFLIFILKYLYISVLYDTMCLLTLYLIKCISCLFNFNFYSIYLPCVISQFLSYFNLDDLLEFGPTRKIQISTLNLREQLITT